MLKDTIISPNNHSQSINEFCLFSILYRTLFYIFFSTWLVAQIIFVLKSQFIFSTQVSLNLNYWMMLNFNGVAISFAKLVGGF